jgi:cobalamin biosynthesis protein CobT
MAEEINRHHELIPPAELWYEDEDTVRHMVPSHNIAAQWMRTNIVQISEADLEPEREHVNRAGRDVTIHCGFVEEGRSRRLARKRCHGRQLSDSSSPENPSENIAEEMDMSTSHPTEPPRSKTPEEDGSHTPEEDRSHTPEEDGSHTPEEDESHTPEEDGSHTPEEHGSHTPKEDGLHTPEEYAPQTLEADGSHTPYEDGADTPEAGALPWNNEPSTSTGITHPPQTFWSTIKNWWH